MKTKLVSLIASAFAFAAFTAHAETTLSVAATAVPHAEILEHVKPALAKEGISSISLNPDSVVATWQQLAG